MTDVLRVVAPPRIYQYIAFYDNSATHNKRGDMTLATSRLNAKWGGRQLGLRDSKLVDGCVGPNPAMMWYLPCESVDEGVKWVSKGTEGAVGHDCTLKTGDVDYGRFQKDDPPPFYDLDAQKYDRVMTAAEKAVEMGRSVHIARPIHFTIIIYVVCMYVYSRDFVSLSGGKTLREKH